MTAVEYLVQQIFGEHTEAWKEEIQQALEMEKEQIIDAATWGALQETGEKYYSETYKRSGDNLKTHILKSGGEIGRR